MPSKFCFVFPNFKGENHLKLKSTDTKEKKKNPDFIYSIQKNKTKLGVGRALIICHYLICLINIWTEC